MYNNPTPYPSVTEIIKPYINTEFYTEECCDRGSAVHAAAAAHLQGLYAPPLQPDWQLYVDSFKRWADIMIDKVFLVETRLVDKVMGFCGQKDLIAKLRRDTLLTLIDWKTSASCLKYWELQIAAYRHLAKKDRNILTGRGMCVRLKANGKMPKPDEYKKDYTLAFNDFIAYLVVFKTKEKYFGRAINE